jgi:hypothetical protein
MWSTAVRRSVEDVNPRLMEEVMNHIARLAGCLAGTAFTVLLLTPAAASATVPAPDGPAQPRAGIERVEVPMPVPVDDSTAEAVQMAVAAALGAAIATAATAARRRRGRTENGLIDLTGAAQP